MASSSDNITGPFWHAEARQHYWYYADIDILVFQNGNRMRRPESVPRESLLAPSPPALPPYSYSGSPPRNDAHYILTSGSGPRSGVGPVQNTVTSHSDQQRGQRGTSTSSQTPGPSNAPGPSNIPAATTLLGDLSVRDSSTSRPGYSTSQYALPRNRQQYGGAPDASTDQRRPNPSHHPAAGPQQQQHTVGSSRLSNDNVDTTRSGTQGREVVQAVDRRNLVVTKYQTGPQQMIADANLAKRGIPTYRLLLGTGSEGNTERLFNTFQLRPQPRKFFTLGKVFMVLWVEPAGESKTIVTKKEPGTSTGRFGEAVFSKVRRFVVIREGQTYCSALPIATYGEQGVGKHGVTKSEHAIIHTGRKAPEPMPSEEPVRGELPMRPQPIRVDPDDPEEKLDPRSRLDFGKVTTVQHNIKVRSYGKVNDKYMNALQHQFMNVWSSTTSLFSNAIASSQSSQPSSSKDLVSPRVPAAPRRQSISSSQRSQHDVRSASSRTGKAKASHPQAAPERNQATEEEDESQAEARRQRRRLHQFWNAVDELEENGHSRESAIKKISEQSRLAQNSQSRDTDDDDGNDGDDNDGDDNDGDDNDGDDDDGDDDDDSQEGDEE